MKIKKAAIVSNVDELLASTLQSFVNDCELFLLAANGFALSNERW